MKVQHTYKVMALTMGQNASHCNKAIRAWQEYPYIDPQQLADTVVWERFRSIVIKELLRSKRNKWRK